jgi:hypothetical protein
LKICIVSGTLREITQWETAVSSLIDTQEKVIRGIRKKTTKKGEDNIEDKEFQQSKETVVVIFARIPGSRSKHQDKQALQTIMVAEPATPGTSIGHSIQSSFQED